MEVGDGQRWVGALTSGCAVPSACPGAAPEGCPAAAALAEMLVAEPGADVAAALHTAAPASLCPAERAVLLAVWDRYATAVAWRRDEQMLDVCRAAEQVLDRAYAQLGDPTPAQRTGYRHVRSGVPGIDEIAVVMRLSEGSVRHRLDDARELRDTDAHPGLGAMVASGTVGQWHALQVLHVLHEQGINDAVLCAKVTVHEQVQTALAAGTPGQIRSTVARVVALLLPAPEAEDEHGQARDGRDVTWDPAGRGMGRLEAWLPAEDLAAIAARLQAGVAEALARRDPRTGGQVRADMLADWGWQGLLPLADVDHGAGHDGPDGSSGPLAAQTGRVGVRIHATVPLSVLLGLVEAQARLRTVGVGSADFGWVTSSVVRELLTREGADWRRFLTDDNGLVLGVSRAYRVPEELARGRPGPLRPRTGGHPPRHRPRRPLDARRGPGTHPPGQPAAPRPTSAQPQDPRWMDLLPGRGQRRRDLAHPARADAHGLSRPSLAARRARRAGPGPTRGPTAGPSSTVTLRRTATLLTPTAARCPGARHRPLAQPTVSGKASFQTGS